MQKYNGRRMFTLCGYLLGCFALTFGQNPWPNCSVPERSLVWDDSLTGSTVTVEWAYGKATCATIRQCYGESWLPDDRVEPQLRPVEIQQGMHIRFHPIKDSGIRFPIQPFKVNEDNYRNCSTNDSIPVISKESEEDFLLDDSFLQNGANYFIVDMNDERLIRCIFGLRLKVVVKENDCSLHEGPLTCSGNGHCVTQKLAGDYHCSCCHGYTGDYCELVDHCADEPCQNGGKCSLYFGQNPEKNYSCECKEEPGYKFVGDSCETNITSLCDLNPCENGAICRGNLQRYSCFCQPGFSGHHCEVNINECESSPCGSGMCVDHDNGFQCFCLPGFGGEQCQIQYNECVSNPCLNGGFCVDELDSFRCDCGMGYNGSLCEQKVSPCADNPCRNGSHAECEDHVDSFTCVCKPGYTGSHCEVNINECEENPCENGGTCKDEVNGYSCLCSDFYFGDRCEKLDEIIRPSRHGGAGFEQETFGMHIHNLYIVGGTLGGALVIALVVLITCYCRTHRTYETLSRRAGYERQTDDFRFASHDVSSVCRPRPSIDSIWEATTLNYHSNQLNTPVAKSLKPKKV
ncbi:fibropellin-1-like [Liolophura sinensis]|uniref:fibropellin-1-like n=1 Tax=Liolophura sinensis TaxID=3198878 RepID=UPI003159136C